VNILDEQIPESQRQLSKSWHIPIHQIGYDVGRKGLKDREIIPFLHQLHRVTFFTLDFDFYRRGLCYSRYCLVCMDVQKEEAATYVRRLLHHPEFDTVAKRMGKVIRVSSMGVWMWRLHAEKEEYFHS
jgi:hypothetical protein